MAFGVGVETEYEIVLRAGSKDRCRVRQMREEWTDCGLWQDIDECVMLGCKQFSPEYSSGFVIREVV
jgi:hypothetical protein